MKNVFVVIIVLFSQAVFSQEGNKTDAKGKQGEWKKYHENGALRYVGSFKNDQPIGEFTYYYNTGKIQSKMTHTKNGSYSITYHKEGGPKAVGKFVNQKKDSTWVYYDLDGYKIASDYYVKGLRNRISKTFYQSGKVAEEKEYKDDFEQGSWNKYWEDGKKKMTATYEKGALEGKAVYYNSLGVRSISGYYYHSLRNGIWVYFEDDGKAVKKKEEYNNGKKVYKNEDDKYIKPEDQEPINEDFLNPESFGMPR